MKATLSVTLICILLSLVVVYPVYSQENAKLLAAPDIIPPATETMQHPEFWVNRLDDPDRIIMSHEEIQEFNKNNQSRSLERKDIHDKTIKIDNIVSQGNFTGIQFHLEDPLKLKIVSGKSLHEKFRQTRDYLMNGDLWDRRNIPYPDSRKQEIIADFNESSIPESVLPRYGITVKHTLNRVVPTHEKVYRSQYNWLDMFQNAVLETGMPVAILHESKDRDWLFVKSVYSTGWVPAANIAESPVKDIRLLVESDDFIVATAHKIPIYADRDCNTWLTDIYMGAKLKLKKKSKIGYNILVPFRNPDGSLKAIDGWIKPDADVNVGFQPYTQRNVISTIFKLLNRPYGWGGTDHERDCVGTIRAVFKTFGIFTPRWTTFQLYHTDHVITFPPEEPKDVKYRYLDSCEPGITVCGFNWHVVLYLGKVDDVHYVIHQNGFSYHDEDGTEYRVGRVSVNYTELEGGADITRWTALSIFKP